MVCYLFKLSSSSLISSSVISLSSVVNDIPILSQNVRVDYVFMTIILLTLILPTIKSGKIHRGQGVLLLGSYITYLITLYIMYLA